MRKLRFPAAIALAALLVASVALAKDKRTYQKGVLLQMESVACGYDQKSGKSLAGSIIGTDSGSSKTREMLCQEYVLRSERIVYRIRPKDEKKPALLPVGDTVEFRIDKDKLRLRTLDDEKEREYIVVSMTPRAEAKDSKEPCSASNR